MSTRKARKIVNQDREKWNEAIQNASDLLEKVEKRAIRLKGAIKTFTESRDLGQPFSESATHN